MATGDHAMGPHVDDYARPAGMTSAGRHAALFADVPRGVAELARVAQGLILHEHIAPAYGVTLTDERRGSVHLRPVERMLDRLLAEDDRPLGTARPAASRLAGNCRHFSVLMVAMLRANGVPARARCGFGGYFVGGRFEDHWLCEYWHADDARWVLVDAQIDDLQRDLFRPDFDLGDVPRDRFLIAGDAWARCRAGGADPATFGLSVIDEGGLWFIAQNLMRDLAALNNMEMLPWDGWGAMPGPDEPLGEETLALFDRLAALTHDPDAAYAEVRASYEGDERLRVPATVRNAVRDREEAVFA